VILRTVYAWSSRGTWEASRNNQAPKPRAVEQRVFSFGEMGSDSSDPRRA